MTDLLLNKTASLKKSYTSFILLIEVTLFSEFFSYSIPQIDLIRILETININ